MTVRTIRGSRSPGCSIAAVSASMGRASANCGSVAYRSAMRRASRSSRGSVDIKSLVLLISSISLCNNNSTVGRTGRIARRPAGRPDALPAARWAFEVGRYPKIGAGGKR